MFDGVVLFASLVSIWYFEVEQTVVFWLNCLKITFCKLGIVVFVSLICIWLIWSCTEFFKIWFWSFCAMKLFKDHIFCLMGIVLLLLVWCVFGLSEVEQLFRYCFMNFVLWNCLKITFCKMGSVLFLLVWRVFGLYWSWTNSSAFVF